MNLIQSRKFTEELRQRNVTDAKKDWGYSPYFGTDSLKGAPDSSYMITSTSGKNIRSSQPISSLQRLFIASEGDSASIFRNDAKATSTAEDSIIFASNDQDEEDYGNCTDSSDKSDDSGILEIRLMDRHVIHAIETTSPKSNQILEGGSENCALDLRQRPICDTDLPYDFDEGSSNVLSNGAGRTQTASKTAIRGFRVYSPFSSRSTSFCCAYPIFPSELSTPNTPLGESISSFFSAPNFSYPNTPAHSAKYGLGRSPRNLSPRPQMTTQRLTPRLTPRLAKYEVVAEDSIAHDSIDCTEFNMPSDSTSQKSYYREGDCGRIRYFSMVDACGARRTVREIVRTWGVKYLEDEECR